MPRCAAHPPCRTGVQGDIVGVKSKLRISVAAYTQACGPAKRNQGSRAARRGIDGGSGEDLCYLRRRWKFQHRSAPPTAPPAGTVGREVRSELGMGRNKGLNKLRKKNALDRNGASGNGKSRVPAAAASAGRGG